MPPSCHERGWLRTHDRARTACWARGGTGRGRRGWWGGQVAGAVELLSQPVRQGGRFTSVADRGVGAVLGGTTRSDDVAAVGPDIDLPGQSTAGTGACRGLPPQVARRPAASTSASRYRHKPYARRTCDDPVPGPLDLLLNGTGPREGLAGPRPAGSDRSAISCANASAARWARPPARSPPSSTPSPSRPPRLPERTPAATTARRRSTPMSESTPNGERQPRKGRSLKAQ